MIPWLRVQDLIRETLICENDSLRLNIRVRAILWLANYHEMRTCLIESPSKDQKDPDAHQTYSSICFHADRCTSMGDGMELVFVKAILGLA